MADDKISDLGVTGSTKKRSFVSNQKRMVFENSSCKKRESTGMGLDDSVRMEDELNESYESIEFDPFMDLERIERRERVDIQQVEKMQYQIKWKMRSILFDWLAEVCSDYQLTRDTFHYATRYLDFLLENKKNIKKSQFQLVGLTALFLASKMEEIIAPSVVDLCDFSSDLFRREEMLAMEQVIVQVNIYSSYPLGNSMATASCDSYPVGQPSYQQLGSLLPVRTWTQGV